MRSEPRDQGFTLVELVAVLVVTAVLAASAMPAFASLRTGGRAALATEVERRTQLAQARSMATGRATAGRLDLAAQTVVLLELAADGAPAPVDGVAGATTRRQTLRGRFAGAEITSVDIAGDGRSIWFDHRGAPQTRDAAGAAAAPLDRPAEIVVDGLVPIRVQPVTGLVER